MDKLIELHHYAIFREARGSRVESVTTRADTPRELFEELHLGSVIPLGIPQLRVAINDRVTSWDDPIRDGDVIVFLAPMSGG